MNIYFTTCNPINYSLNKNWEDEKRMVLWGYGKKPDGKFPSSSPNDVVFIMYNDTAHNNQGDILYHCVIEEGYEEFQTLDSYMNNPTDGIYVNRRVNNEQPLKFYRLRMEGKTERINKSVIIDNQNENDPILAFSRDNNTWGYSQSVKKLSSDEHHYLECGFSKLLIDYKDELNLSNEIVEYLRQQVSNTQNPIADVSTIIAPALENQPIQIDKPRNLIVFGAPGTGKSYHLNTEIKLFDKVERVTFYPSYSYSQFVGCYKPTMKGENIAYSFVPGPFLKTYVDAIKDFSKNYLLIIEEINRADAASVFGDVFQLLDRDEEGKSVYSISASEDIKKYLEGEKISSGKLSIPSNMYIWATMNSADQGVFPMDTAFKRRWDFLYFNLDGKPIEDEEDCPVSKNNWESIRIEINKWLCEKKVNEDKLLGKYFINAGDKVTEKDFRYAFKNKVLMYLYEDAARAYRSELFEKNSFSEILSKFNSNGTLIFKPEKIKDIAKKEDNEEERATE